MTVTVTPLAQDERQNHRFLGTATLGDGTKKVMGVHHDPALAEQMALNKAQKAERALAAVEVHPEGLNMSPSEGNRLLKDPAGVLVEVPLTVVQALLDVGYEPADLPDPVPPLAASNAASPALAGDLRHPLEDATDEPPPRRRPGRPAKQPVDDE